MIYFSQIILEGLLFVCLQDYNILIYYLQKKYIYTGAEQNPSSQKYLFAKKKEKKKREGI